MSRLIIDGHNDTMMHIINSKTWLPELNIGESSKLHIDLKKMEKGGLNNPIFAAFAKGYYDERGENFAKSLSRSLAIVNALYWTEEKNKDKFQINNGVDEIIANFEDGKLGASLAIEGAYFINKDNYREILRQFRDLRVKILGFTWNYSNSLAEGAAGVYADKKTKSPKGLSQLGIDVLSEMEDLGIAIDVSHMSEESFWGVVENYKKPIIASHSAVYNLRNHVRNLKDKQIEAIRDSNGVIGVVMCNAFLKEEKEVYLDDYLEHLDYIVNLVGVDHVALGSDFDGTTIPLDLKDASELGKLEDKLKSRGYSEDDIDKIMGGNFLRVFKESEKEQVQDKLKLKTSYSMGGILRDKKISYKILEEGQYNVKLILDGRIVSENKVRGLETNSLELNNLNSELFHIITLEISKNKFKHRDTKIIYNKIL